MNDSSQPQLPRGAALAKRIGTLPVIAASAMLGADGAALSMQAQSLDILPAERYSY